MFRVTTRSISRASSRSCARWTGTPRRITEYSPETVRVEIEAGAHGMLVLSDVIDPAWHARVDDAPAEIYVADGSLRAVAVPPASTRLSFSTRPPRCRLAQRSPG